MPVAAEMDALEAEVGGYQRLVAGRKAEDGAVVTNAEANPWTTPCGNPPNPLQQRLFLQGHRQPPALTQRQCISVPPV